MGSVPDLQICIDVNWTVVGFVLASLYFPFYVLLFCSSVV